MPEHRVIQNMNCFNKTLTLLIVGTVKRM